MPASRSDLFDCLEDLGINTETVEHEAVFTVAESSNLERDMPGAHSKNLFLKCKKGNLFLLVALDNTKIKLNTLHKAFESGRLSFGKPELLEEVLGVKPGSVTPFSLINDTQTKVNVILDEAMMAFDQLNFHPLENTATTSISRDDLLAFIRACGHEPRIMNVGAAPID